MSENKYKWLEFDGQPDLDRLSKEIKTREASFFVSGMGHQHSKDKAIMLKLLEIVQTQNEALRKVLPEVYCLYNQVTGNRLDREKEGSVFSAYFGAKQTLTKTERMLKEIDKLK